MWWALTNNLEYWKWKPSNKQSWNKLKKEKEKTTRNQTKWQKSHQMGCPLVRYSEPILKWTWEELQQTDQKTIKLMTMYKDLHPRNDVSRLYESIKGKKGHASIQDSVDASILRRQTLHKKVQSKCYKNNADNTNINRATTARKQKWENSKCMEISSDKQTKSHTRKLILG